MQLVVSNFETWNTVNLFAAHCCVDVTNIMTHNIMISCLSAQGGNDQGAGGRQVIFYTQWWVIRAQIIGYSVIKAANGPDPVPWVSSRTWQHIGAGVPWLL